MIEMPREQVLSSAPQPAPINQDQLPAGQERPGPTEEESRAAAAAFAKSEENQAAASILGAWSAGMLLHDMIEDAQAKEAEEEEEDPSIAKPRKAESPPPGDSESGE